MPRNTFSQCDDPRACEDEPYKCAKCGSYCIPEEISPISTGNICIYVMHKCEEY